MAEYFTNNRQLIKDLKINTGSTGTPTWSSLCCASEMTLNMDVNSDDFYVWCDAVQRHIQSGMALTLETTLKNGEKMKEKSCVELELKEGTRLVWLEGKGYILPGENFKTLAEIREDLEYLKDLG